MTQFFILEISGGADLSLHGPFIHPKAFADAAQKVRDEQDPGSDSIFALQLQDGKLSQIPAPGEDPEH
jgi:hypothetical protein